MEEAEKDSEVKQGRTDEPSLHVVSKSAPLLVCDSPYHRDFRTNFISTRSATVTKPDNLFTQPSVLHCFSNALRSEFQGQIRTPQVGLSFGQ